MPHFMCVPRTLISGLTWIIPFHVHSYTVKQMLRSCFTDVEAEAPLSDALGFCEGSIYLFICQHTFVMSVFLSRAMLSLLAFCIVTVFIAV